MNKYRHKLKRIKFDVSIRARQTKITPTSPFKIDEAIVREKNTLFKYKYKYTYMNKYEIQ